MGFDSHIRSARFVSQAESAGMAAIGRGGVAPCVTCQGKHRPGTSAERDRLARESLREAELITVGILRERPNNAGHPLCGLTCAGTDA
jgi:hypothetical protein